MDLKKLRNLGLSVLTAFGLFSFSSCNTPDNNSGLNVEFSNKDFYLEASVNKDNCVLEVDGNDYGSFENKTLDVYVSDGSHEFTVVCGDDSVSVNKSVSLINGYTLLNDTAASYWDSIQGSQDVDVSVYDTNNDGGFSNFEKQALDFYKQLLDDGFSSSKIQDFVDYFSSVGPMTIFALNKSYESYKYFFQFNSDLVFSPEFVGWIDIDGITNVKNELGDYYLYPTRYADPNISGLQRINSYPINRFSTDPGFEDLLPDSEDMDTCFSKFYGFTKLKYYGENYSNNSIGTSSLDISFDRDKILSLSQTPGYFNISPLKAKILTILNYRMMNTWDNYPYDDIDISLEMYIPPTDRRLFDTETHKLLFIYNHISLPGKTTISVDEYKNITGLYEGKIIDYGQQIGVIQHNVGNSDIIVDFLVTAIGNTPELGTVTMTVPGRYFGKDVFFNTLDPTCGYVYPDHFKANTTNPAYNQDLSLFAPSWWIDPDLGDVVYENIPRGYAPDVLVNNSSNSVGYSGVVYNFR